MAGCPDPSKPRYQDYVIQDGVLVGEFEEMYAAFEDPWHSVEHVGSIKNDVLLALIARCECRGFLHAGCGLGALSARLRSILPESSELWALDISTTAIDKARDRYTGIDFFVHDLAETAGLIKRFENRYIDGILMAETMWYILPELKNVLRAFFRILSPGGSLFVMQYFLEPKEQTYGQCYVQKPEDLESYLVEAGFSIEQELFPNPRASRQTIYTCRKEIANQ